MVSRTYTTGDLRLTDTTYIPPKNWRHKSISTDQTTTPRNYSFGGTTATYTSISYTVITRLSKEELKKQLKRIMDKWCIDSWTQTITLPSSPKLPPKSFRGIRLEGRGWASI